MMMRYRKWLKFRRTSTQLLSFRPSRPTTTLTQKLQDRGDYLEGDIRAAERAPGEKSVCFHARSGNRLQLIVLPASAPAA